MAARKPKEREVHKTLQSEGKGLRTMRNHSKCSRKITMQHEMSWNFWYLIID